MEAPAADGPVRLGIILGFAEILLADLIATIRRPDDLVTGETVIREPRVAIKSVVPAHRRRPP